MINIMGKGLPDTVLIGGEPFSIKTDFRVWMQFCNFFERWDGSGDLDIAFIFIDRVPVIETVADMGAILSFAYPAAIVPKSSGGVPGRVLDYDIDSDYLYSAFLGQYGVDLLEEQMHWHKFRALLNGLNSSTRLYEIMGYRCYDGKDRDYIKLRSAWELPAVLTMEDKGAKDEFDSYFN